MMLMTEMSRGFNFDDFDEQVRDALEQNDEAMAEILPGKIGAIATAAIELPPPVEHGFNLNGDYV